MIQLLKTQMLNQFFSVIEHPDKSPLPPFKKGGNWAPPLKKG